MSEEQIINNIKILKNKIKLTESQNLKKKYLNDICVLLEYLSQTYGMELDPDITYNEFLYENYASNYEKDLCMQEEELLSIISTTESLADQSINTFDKCGFYPFTIPKYRGADTSFYNDLMLEFTSSLGNNVYKKYIELVTDGVLLSSLGPKYSGGCWDFPTMDKQSICVSTLGFELYPVLAHELGHAIHFDALNKVGRRSLVSNVFVESLSTLYELLFLDFLEKNNVDINNRLRDFYFTFLVFCVKVKTYIQLSSEDLLEGGELKLEDKSDLINSYFEYILKEEIELDFLKIVNIFMEP